MTRNNDSDNEPNLTTKSARLIVRNISFKATEETLKEHCSQYGSVEEVKLLRKPDGKLVGCGFVQYTNVPMANKALSALNKKTYLDRPLHVAWALPKHKYVEKNEPSFVPKKEKHSPENTVSFEDDDIEEKKPKNIKNKVRINRNARLIVRNVSFKATEDILRKHFQPYGEIQEVKLLKKPDGKLVGCAFVHFKNVPMAKKALLSTNMKPFLGRPVSVDWAVAKNKYMQHIVNKQVEMQDDVKEEPDSDEDCSPPINISNDDLKQEIKSESSDEDEDNDDEDDDSNDDDDKEDSSDEDKKKIKPLKYESSEEDSEDEVMSQDGDDDDNDDDTQSQISTIPEHKRVRLEDAEDGRTVFVTNVSFSVDSDQLRQFAENFAPVTYALICVDRLTEHSKGSGFIKFTKNEDAEKFLSLPPDALKLEGQVMQAKPALKKENLQKGDKKQPKDNRNLYLVKEGVIVAGTKAAQGVSASDMTKRLALERSKTQMLKNLNRFVSRYRIVVSNLPANWDDKRLRAACAAAVWGSTDKKKGVSTLTEARVMRDLRAPADKYGQHPSKGYGFVMFTRHEDALACLRKLNNNPDIFDKNNRPIVSFSIEDRTALNARKKRLEKSIANNPLTKKINNADNEAYKNRKRKSQAPPDESYLKKRKFDNKQTKNQNKPNTESGKFVRRPQNEEVDAYTGLTAKEGAQHKMRSNHKLRTQADIHRQQVKTEKKKNKRALLLKKAHRERIKLPKQKVNTTAGKKNKRRKFKPNNIKDILK